MAEKKSLGHLFQSIPVVGKWFGGGGKPSGIDPGATVTVESTGDPSMVQETVAMPGPYQAAVAKLQKDNAIRNDGFFVTDQEYDAQRQRGLMAVICTGGDREDGDRANQAAKATYIAFNGSDTRMPPEIRLLSCMASAQNRMLEMNAATGRVSGVTFTGALLDPDGGLSFLNVGTGHIFLMREGGLLQLNREHIQLFRKREAWAVYEESSGSREDDHKILSYLGMEKLTKMDRNTRPIALFKGDRIVVMSDLIFHILNEKQLVEHLQKPLQESAKSVMQEIQTRRPDITKNATIIVVEVTEDV